MIRMVGALLASILVAAVLSAGWLASSDKETTQANPGVGLGIDADPSGNTRTSLGTIEPCVRIGTNQTAEVDVFITGVTDLLVWHVAVVYEPSKVNVVGRDVQFFAAAGVGSDVKDDSFGDPDLRGTYDLLASDVSEPPVPESGSGVLARLTLRGMGPGLTAVRVEDPRMFGTPLPRQIGADLITNAWVAVDQDCPSEPPPTPTPTPTPEPSPTPGPSSTPEPTGTPIPSPSSTPSPGPSSTPGTPTPTPPPGTVNLVNGWNDACYQGPEQQISDAFAGVTGVQAVYRMRNQTFERWFPDRPDLSTITALSPFDKILILMSEGGTWTVAPDSDSPSSVRLPPGWNGVCYLGTGKDTETAAAGITGDFAVIYTLAPDHSWRRYLAGRPEMSNLQRLEKFTPILILMIGADDALWVFEP